MPADLRRTLEPERVQREHYWMPKLERIAAQSLCRRTLAATLHSAPLMNKNKQAIRSIAAFQEFRDR